MIFLEFPRIIKFAFQNFFRNFWLSLVTVLIIILSLVSMSILLISNLLTDHVLSVVQTKTEVYIDMTAEATPEQAQVLVSELNDLPAVEQAVFISPEQTLENFKERNKDKPAVLESLASLEKNPFAGSIKLSINKIEDFPAILSELSKDEYAKFLEIDDQEFSDSKFFVERLSEYSRDIRKGWTIVSLIFVLISILVVYNTIQMNIYTQREEIGIMKLVGASNSFVRSPFLFEGILYSLVAIGILLAIAYPILALVQPYVDGFFRDYSLNLVEAVNQNFFRIFGVQLAVAIIITIFSSFLAIRKYIRV